ncbi:hypothetical protein E3T26_00475 [Cryobacterium sp. TMT1-21]|uniref:Uncharacterized protein n=1 Tax=Cryobacterium shii TaxID=1259235 RepID=A0AAQ2C818_9MICO|nr:MULTISPECIES: hypothetical protein [Cryobacterium]TFC50181.1 hypothetical protein E3O49_05385 [Cryobacterium shii]TFC83171.1 hypothetical protein E3T24_12195 [Cryobacterium sp. TmT2-59]TFD17980.1 hypothetical protein E3T42_06780 [Cryobacterium sp. TMT4-10]TFD18132.1 hypothetical protein E3T26_00475 [Cryobacterium sp. TMT1-21]TFD25000.1 hypothetical protein E3T32_04330 [Cryobacterium sp. TMT2-23]
MDTFNWVYSIPLIAIIGGITVAMYAIYLKNKHGGEEGTAGLENAALNRQVLDRLDSIDARLAAVEKSLREHA